MSEYGLTATAQTILERRYFARGGDKHWVDLCKRVANAIGNTDSEEYEFFELIASRKFLPNSPTLMNAGTPLGQLSACFVVGIDDSMESIFNALKNAAKIHQSGGGTGFNFSKLREHGSIVKTSKGIASGPVSFMRIFNAATEEIKQGGTRKGANMGILSVDHPDIEAFIDAKLDPQEFTNFNISVGITKGFMDAVEEDKDFDLISRDTNEPVKVVRARELWQRMVNNAWKIGDPGLLFLDTANESNPTPHLGRLEACNPCSEQVLYNEESCNLGSLNLDKYTKYYFDTPTNEPWNCLNEVELRADVRLAVRFLDNVIDKNNYPLDEIEKKTKLTRKIGLGIMGLHDMLIKMNVPYNSKLGRTLAGDVMSVIKNEALSSSEQLYKEKGPYPGSDGKDFRRNAALLSIQPTGSVSMIADCASGCEPYFAVTVEKHVMDNDKLILVNKHFKKIGIYEGWYNDSIVEDIWEKGTLVDHPDIPKSKQQLFACAQEIPYQSHIAMQAELQKHIDGGISKTINMPENATVKDIHEAYLLAYKGKCKGITVYRDGCRAEQVLHTGKQLKEYRGVEARDTGGVNPQEVLMIRDLQAVERAERHRVTWKGTKLYLTVSIDDDDMPLEIFAKLPREAGMIKDVYDPAKYQESASNWDLACRLLSLLLRTGMPVDEILNQMNKASFTMVDAAGVLSRVLQTYYFPDYADEIDSTTSAEEIEENGFGAKCPDCSRYTVIREGGCLTCRACGYSKCS